MLFQALIIFVVSGTYYFIS